MKGKKQKDK